MDFTSFKPLDLPHSKGHTYPPDINETHHQLWFSMDNCRYVKDTVMQAVTIKRMTNTK